MTVGTRNYLKSTYLLLYNIHIFFNTNIDDINALSVVVDILLYYEGLVFEFV